MRNRYGAKKTTYDGITFDSRMEADFYLFLKGLKEEGKIKDFKMQTRYEILPAYTRSDGKKIRKIEYLPDFEVIHHDGTEEVIDVKGMETDVFKLKKKMFEYRYPNKIIKCVQYSRLDNGWIDLDDLKQARKARKKARGK